MLDALRLPDFRFLLIGDLVSGLGSSLLVVALPYRVFQLTGSPTATGLALAAEALPALLAGPVAGVFVDRWDRRRVLIAANLARGVVLAGFLLADRPDRVGWVYATLFAESVGTMFFRPAARALRPAVLGTGPALAGGNALLGVTGGVVQLAGPPVGVLVLIGFGLPGLVFADMASYLVAAGAVALTGRRPATTRADRTVAAVLVELRDGLRVITGRPVLRWLLPLCVAYFTANGVFTALLIPYMTTRFGDHPHAIGWQLSALGAGFLVGAPLGGRLVRDRPARWPLSGGLAGVGVCYAVLANAPAIPVAIVATGLAGLPGSVLLVTVETAIQRGSPPEPLGRVGAAFYAADAAADVAGALLGAGFAGSARLPTVLTAGAAVILVSAAVAPLAVRDPTDRHIDRWHCSVRGILAGEAGKPGSESPGQRADVDRRWKSPEGPGI
ncbi:MAG TPA: MFS transporter [Pseudonocardiaceae bacterium]|nr:MFS transporter [Pseudonocardiaceae bacterium]